MKDKMFEERKEEQEKQCAAGMCDAKAAAEQTDKLLEFSRAPENFVRDSLLNNMQKSNSQAISNMIANDNRSEVHNHYDFGGVVVEHPVDADDLVSSLVRQANSRWGVTKNMKNI